MLGKNTFLGILGLVVLFSGCTLPCHVHDYCGPVYDSGQNCTNFRAGSILADGDAALISTAPDEGIIEESASNVESNMESNVESNIQRRQPSTEEYEGATQIVSVTDRKVGETESTTESQGEAEQYTPVLARPSTSKLRWR
jgi:hypothetical protein